jgi:hypothetical protein
MFFGLINAHRFVDLLIMRTRQSGRQKTSPTQEKRASFSSTVTVFGNADLSEIIEPERFSKEHGLFIVNILNL